MNGNLLCLGITIADDYSQYCTLLLEANGITRFQVEQLEGCPTTKATNMAAILHIPDRADVSFELEDTVRGKTKFIDFFYTLPESSRWPDRTPGFKQLGHYEQTERCVETVTDDLRGIARTG